jgi:hypothetical protein
LSGPEAIPDRTPVLAFHREHGASLASISCTI